MTEAAMGHRPSRRTVVLGFVSLAVAACTEGGLKPGREADERFYARYCRNLGHAEGAADYTTCVTDKRREIETERRRRAHPDFF